MFKLLFVLVPGIVSPILTGYITKDGVRKNEFTKLLILLMMENLLFLRL